MEYKVLTNSPSNLNLGVSPSGYWLLLQFEIVIKAKDEYALLVTHHSYILKKENDYESGIICPPFIAFAVNSDELYLDTVEDIRQGSLVVKADDFSATLTTQHTNSLNDY